MRKTKQFRMKYKISYISTPSNPQREPRNSLCCQSVVFHANVLFIIYILLFYIIIYLIQVILYHSENMNFNLMQGK